MSHYYDDRKPSVEDLQDDRDMDRLMKMPVTDLLKMGFTFREFTELAQVDQYPNTALKTFRKRDKEGS